MKKLSALLALLSITTFALAQRGRDALYLKNGSIIRGTVMELEPTGSVKIKAADGSLYVYPMSEVERISKDEPSSERLSPPPPPASKAEREPDEPMTASHSKSSRIQAKSGYVGIGFGWAASVGDYRKLSPRRHGSRFGVQPNVLNFGFLFSENVGIQASLLYGSIRYQIPYEDDRNWWYSGVTAGALFSVPLTRWLAIDFRPSIGFMLVSAPGILTREDNNEGITLTHFMLLPALPVSAGASLRMLVAKRLVLSLNSDIMSIVPAGRNLPDLGVTTVTAGVAFKLGK